jgi:response regulator RpfG family c-di-GMP phosphodiesterase
MNAVESPAVTEAADPGSAAPDGRACVLCVDDEPNILSALRRTLRADGLRVLTAQGGQEALETLERESVDVVISDMRMPGMDGAELLERVHERWPANIRVLLTGHADTSAAVAAINRGRIFRYLTKPWDDAELRSVLRQGLDLLQLERERARLEALTTRQNLELRDANERLEQRVQERTDALARANDSLKRSYLTSIKVFSGLIELRGGRLAGHGRRVADVARKLAVAMGRSDDEAQQIFVAALLHDIGMIGVPDAILAKPVARCAPEEAVQLQRHAEIGEQALMPLEEMQPVAALIRAHHERFDGEGFPDKRAGADIPIGARILAVADAFDELQNGHLVEAAMSAQDARTVIRHGRGKQFDPEVVDVFLHITEPQRPKVAPEVQLGAALLEPDMVLARDLVSPTGVLMLAAGHVLTASLIRRVQEFDQRVDGKLVIHVKPREKT